MRRAETTMKYYFLEGRRRKTIRSARTITMQIFTSSSLNRVL
jgi:hypothetical protein